MNYQQTLDYLYSFFDSERKLHRTPAEFNLTRTAALLRAIGEPQHAFDSIVIAGTKGKGSTAALLESIIRTAGYRTGLWTSPHLHSYRERIQINRGLIGQHELAGLVAELQLAIEQIDAETHHSLTTFEIGFAIALHYFARQHVDLAILEVGLGGRYDCANVVPRQLAVITSISYDHMRILGDTLAQIAHDKAGIIQPGIPAITIPQHPEAMDEIMHVAHAVGAPLWVAQAAEGRDRGPGMRLTLQRAPGPQPPAAPDLAYDGPMATALQGIFQRENARLASGAALLLRQAGLDITDDAIARGLASTHWPGRLEIVPGAPPIVLDGAHNGDSAHKLMLSIREAFPGRRIILVLGVMRDKDFDRILPELIPPAAALVLTRSRHPRALHDLAWLANKAAPLLQRGGQRIPLVITPDVPDALAEARTFAGPDDLICVTGTLPVVAAAREALGLANEKD